MSAELDSIIVAFSALKVAPDDARGRPDYYLIGLAMGTAVAKYADLAQQPEQAMRSKDMAFGDNHDIGGGLCIGSIAAVDAQAGLEHGPARIPKKMEPFHYETSTD